LRAHEARVPRNAYLQEDIMDLSELVTLEERGWRALSQGEGGAFYREHMADDGIMVFPVGMYDKAASIGALEGVPPWESYELDDMRLVAVGGTGGSVTYHAWARRAGDPDAYEALMTSVYRRDGERWRLVLHQQTPLASPA
jgi:ketosteroid isomerase-like protein